MAWFKADALKDLTQKVQSAIPKIDKEMLAKLTLTSPELVAERERIDLEERHKERVKDMISMMPWETRDPERDILVEECKEAILKLSSDRHTFSGPFAMPKLSVRLVEEDKEKSAEEGGNEDDKDEEEPPANETLEKLKTLEPLPPLLQDFELDAHVCLIQKLLKIDPQLVQMQSTLSGGGEHERVFWKNYFFHCAWCRYEAGLSIDEIWSDQPLPSAGVGATEQEGVPHEEETITFEKHEDEEPAEKAFSAEPVTDTNSPFQEAGDKDSSAGAASSSAAAVAGTSTNSSESADFEMVGGPEGDDAPPVDDVADYELDELEAEIARELED